MIGLDSVWLLSDTRGVKEKPTVGSEVIIRIGHNLLPARVLAIRETRHPLGAHLLSASTAPIPVHSSASVSSFRLRNDIVDASAHLDFR